MAYNVFFYMGHGNIFSAQKSPITSFMWFDRPLLSLSNGSPMNGISVNDYNTTSVRPELVEG